MFFEGPALVGDQKETNHFGADPKRKSHPLQAQDSGAARPALPATLDEETARRGARSGAGLGGFLVSGSTSLFSLVFSGFRISSTKSESLLAGDLRAAQVCGQRFGWVFEGKPEGMGNSPASDRVQFCQP